MKKVIGLLLLLTTVAVAGVVAAQGAKDASRSASSAAAAPTTPPAGPPCPYGPGMCGGPGHQHMMGGGMGAGAMHGCGGGFCPMQLFTNPAVKMDVKPLPKGATITLTADDPKLVTRIQKTLEMIRLTRDLRATE